MHVLLHFTLEFPLSISIRIIIGLSPEFRYLQVLLGRSDVSGWGAFLKVKLII
jgi:hypothetical protein